ncbi:MAG: hypothetical protein KTR32_08885 [Granulosicoccus sp.]|nr:hypothetical protein [Granulosicoccus sp.]
MILNHLQGKLESRYDLDIPYEVANFVCHDPLMARELSAASIADHNHQAIETNTEVVFVRQLEDTMEMTLYLDRELVTSIENDQANNRTVFEEGQSVPNATVDELCTVVEGVSHVVCLLWHAHNDRQIRPVDLELQAEIDKFMMLMDRYQNQTECRQLHRQLFDHSELIPEPGSNIYERYRIASNMAARYCHWLMVSFAGPYDQSGLDAELARFYRLSGHAKFDYIKRLH